MGIYFNFESFGLMNFESFEYEAIKTENAEYYVITFGLSIKCRNLAAKVPHFLAIIFLSYVIVLQCANAESFIILCE